MPVLLGCIADDFTGGTDLASTLVKHGMRTVLLIDLSADLALDAVDAIVVVLKSRTAPVDEAIDQSLRALHWLQSAGCRQFYFKYCSTFDSTPLGNIGPVAEALMQELGTDFTIACPAFPTNARSVYNGYLFVGEHLLNESSMRDHPLTPMTDANLVRVLQAQCRHPVGLIRHAVIAAGHEAVRKEFSRLSASGVRLAIADALTDEDLHVLGRACDGMSLVTGASGMVQGLPDNFRRQGLLQAGHDAARVPATEGHRAVLAGSCSAATQRQVRAMQQHAPSHQIDVDRLMQGDDIAREALDWASRHIGDQAVLIYSTAAPEAVRALQKREGVASSGARIEQAFARIAQGLIGLGVGQLIVAGGETSGAAVQALGITGLHIGPEIDPGVPWTVALQNESARPLALALKSGNFGSDDFFLKAWSKVP